MFFPVFALLDTTGMPALGSPLRTTRKLLYMEKLMAALLLCGNQVHADLDQAMAQATTSGAQGVTQCYFPGMSGWCAVYSSVYTYCNVL
jgi:hypothetical protein